jgi:aspartate racemase
VAGAITARGLTKVALLGTSYAMERPFFTERFARHGIEVIVPADQHHASINRIIYEELVHGKVLPTSRRSVVGLVDELWDAGAQGIILGCTELELLVHQADSELPLFPSTTLHVAAVLDRALAD